MASQYERTGLSIIGCLAVALFFTVSLLDGGNRLLAQTLAVPSEMPTVYEEVPAYVLARKRARYNVKLPQCTIAARGSQSGYCVKSGGQEFIILNQNPACLKRFAGKIVAVTGKTTESVLPWFDVYFLVVDTINGMRYEGSVAPWAMREPTDEEVSFWILNKRLPPATHKFMAYLDLGHYESWTSWNGPPAPGALTAEPVRLNAATRISR